MALLRASVRAGKRLIERQFVRGLEAAASRQPVRDAREIDGKRLQQLDQIIGRRLAFDIGASARMTLGKFLGLDAREQFLDPQIFRANVIERRDASA